jgi:hypothetical protein
MDTIVPQDNKTQDHISNFMKEHRVAEIMKRSNFRKSKGISCTNVFRLIMLLVFTGKNLYRTMLVEAGDVQCKKDTVYRFLNSTRYNWRNFLLLLSSGIIQDFLKPLTDEQRKGVLVVDDSLFGRSRSKKVELLARIYDHVERRYRKGFRMLTVGWSDGATFIPLAFSLLSSEKRKNRLVEMKEDMDKRTNGYKRRREGIQKAPDVLERLIEQVKAREIDARYLLFDSWFAYPKVIMAMLKQTFHVICMLKDLPTLKYVYEGKFVTLGALYKSVRKKRGRAQVLASVIVRITSGEQSIPVKIVFVRNRNQKRQWLALLSTDTGLSEEEIINLYGRRWDIEVFFKMCKSYLNLAKEFEGRSYDLMVAHTTIVFCRYIMLAVQKRIHDDPRTLGIMFHAFCEQIRDITVQEALELLLETLTVRLMGYLPTHKIREFLSIFIAALPLFLKQRLQFSYCES